MKHWLLLLVLQVGSLALLNGQQSPEVICDAERSQALQQSARDAFDKHQYGAAARTFSEAFQECPAQRDILIDLSQALAHLRQFDLAIGSLREFLDQQPASTPGRLALANVYLMAQRFADAKRESEGILNKDPDNAAAMKIEANAEYLLGNVDAAERRFIDLLDRHPDNEEGAYMLGRIYYQEGQIDYAIGQFERVLKLNPRSYKAHDNLGLCYEARGDNEKAVRHFLASIKLAENDHSDYDWPFANLAELFLKEGEPQKAFALASRAADRNPQSARNFYLGGKALCELKKTDLCLNWLQRSSALDPNYPEPLYLLAHVYQKLGDDGKAKKAQERFLEAKAKQPSHRR
jgi:tetratricopeptide (TPR) repeat protein